MTSRTLLASPLLASRTVLAVGVLIVTLLLGAAPARAEETLTCEVVEIDASKTDKPAIDAALKDLETKLKHAQFSAFNTFRKSARISKSMTTLNSETFTTPHGAVTVIIREIKRPSKKKVRLSLGIQLETKAGKQYTDSRVNIDAGDFTMFARASDRVGVITAVGCR